METSEIGQDYDAMEKAIRLYGYATGFSRGEMVRLLQRLKARLVTHAKGEVIFRQGERARTFALVLAGNLQLIFREADGMSYMLQATHPGEFAGVSLLDRDDPDYPCDVVAYPECRVLVFDLGAALALRQSGVALTFFRMLESQLVRALYDAHWHGVLSLQRNIVTRLLVFLGKRCEVTKSRVVELAGNIADLAAYLGCDRAALSRTISDLCRQGKIARRGRGRYELLAPAPQALAPHT